MNQKIKIGQIWKTTSPRTPYVKIVAHDPASNFILVSAQEHYGLFYVCREELLCVV